MRTAATIITLLAIMGASAFGGTHMPSRISTIKNIGSVLGTPFAQPLVRIPRQAMLPGTSFVVMGKTNDSIESAWRHPDTLSFYQDGFLMRQAIIYAADSSFAFRGNVPPIGIHLFTYNNKGQLIQQQNFNEYVETEIGTFLLNRMTEYTYDDSARLTQSVTLGKIVGQDWAPFTRTSFSYQHGMSLRLAIVDYNNGTGWSPEYRFTYYESQPGLPDSMIYDAYINGQWYRQDKTTYAHPSSDTLIATNFDGHHIVLYVYMASNGLPRYMEERHQGEGNSVDIERTTFSYYDDGLLQGYDQQRISGQGPTSYRTLRTDRKPGPQIFLMSPLPGERFFGADTIPVRFLGTGENTVDLRYNADFGQMWSTFARGLQDTGAGTYRWTPEEVQGGYVRIKAVTGQVSDEMEGTFSILPGREFLAETTATLQCGVFSTGYIGADPTGAPFSPRRDYPGFHYKRNPNSLYSGGVFVGQTGGPLRGMIASFSLKTFEPEVPFEGFTADATFDQRTTCTLSERPPDYRVDITQRTASRKGDDFIFVTYDLTNPVQTPLSDFFVGLFADWDIGDYNTNLGGVDSLRGLAYEYSATGSDRNYYGVVALSGESGAVITTNFPSTAFMERHQFGVVGSTGDLRTFIGSGPFTIAPGAVQSVSFALLAAPSVEGLQMRADSARAFMKRITTGIEPVPEMHGPFMFSLEQNYPNPFNPKTGIRFRVPALSGVEGPSVREVKLAVYDILGREVVVLVNERKAPGSYEVNFDASGLASGAYFYRLTAGSFVQTKRLMLIR